MVIFLRKVIGSTVNKRMTKKKRIMSILMTRYQYTNRKCIHHLIRQQNEHCRDIQSFVISSPYLAYDSSHQQKGKLLGTQTFCPHVGNFPHVS